MPSKTQPRPLIQLGSSTGHGIAKGQLSPSIYIVEIRTVDTEQEGLGSPYFIYI